MKASISFYRSYDWIGFGMGSAHHTWVDPVVYWDPDKEKPRARAKWFWHLSIRLLKREMSATLWAVQRVVRIGTKKDEEIMHKSITGSETDGGEEHVKQVMEMRKEWDASRSHQEEET